MYTDDRNIAHVRELRRKKEEKFDIVTIEFILIILKLTEVFGL